MSRLEKFINNNRSEFDDMAPSEKLWEKVEAAFSVRLHIDWDRVQTSMNETFGHESYFTSTDSWGRQTRRSKTSGLTWSHRSVKP